MDQKHIDCKYFKSEIEAGNVSKIGVCTHPNSGIDVTKNVVSSLCTICHLFKRKREMKKI